MRTIENKLNYFPNGTGGGGGNIPLIYKTGNISKKRKKYIPGTYTKEVLNGVVLNDATPAYYPKQNII
tara:strand:- start:3592 stop:3795 length:204 start_codon:yes stop_codon:yes gene_type:complete